MRSGAGSAFDEYISLEAGTVAGRLIGIVLLVAGHTSISGRGADTEVRGGSSQSLRGLVVALVALGVLTGFWFVLFLLLAVGIVGLPGLVKKEYCVIWLVKLLLEKGADLL